MTDHRKTVPGRPTMPRKPMPLRRRSWTIKGIISGHVFHLGFGEYPDGRLGEIWIDASKNGTTLRGLAGCLSRMTSMALQCGADVREVVSSLSGLNFPPNGIVKRGDHEREGGSRLPSWEVTSVADWVAQEITEAYLDQEDATLLDSDVRPLPERIAGVRDTERENL